MEFEVLKLKLSFFIFRNVIAFQKQNYIFENCLKTNEINFKINIAENTKKKKTSYI